MNYANPDTLVETQWLAQHLDDPQLSIVEIDMNSAAYDQEHIPGSIFWSTADLLRPDSTMNLDPDAIAQLLSNSGISNSTTVVAVHNNYVGTSGCIFWLLKLCGHEKIKILNGGRPKWQAENLPVTSSKNKIKPTNYQLGKYNHNLRVSATELQELLNGDNCLLIDARTPEEYRGEIYLQAPPQAREKAGHIPGAINIYYELAHNNDSTFKSAEELHELYGNLISTDKTIIPYCAVGARSAHTWFILKYLLGYDRVQNYDGSWNEWSRLNDVAIAY